MHTVVLLSYALNVAERLGYAVRQEWIEGNGGGGCVFRGRKVLFIDLAAPPSDQLEIVLNVLRSEPAAAQEEMPNELRAALHMRKIA
jgi:hypothetical protein